MLDIDIWRTATYLIKNRDDAEMYAALRANELLAAGDTEGSRVWIRIGLAIRNLQERENPYSRQPFIQNVLEASSSL